MYTIREIPIDSWDCFDRIVKEHDYRKWVYRGHTNAEWTLKSSLLQAFEEAEHISEAHKGKRKKINRRGHERLSIERFQSHFHLYLNRVPRQENNPLDWLAIMQHHGAPTRLLDVTFSPYVAAYFALETGTGSCAVYAIDHTIFREIDDDFFKDPQKIRDEILEKEADDIIYFYEPSIASQRLLAQQSLFIVPGSLKVSHEDIILKYPHDAVQKVVKLIIPGRLRLDGLHWLRKMNISSSILFPGLDGFCRSFRHQSLFLLQAEKAVR